MRGGRGCDGKRAARNRVAGRVVGTRDVDGCSIGTRQVTATGVAVVANLQRQCGAGCGGIDVVGVGQCAAIATGEQVVQLGLGAIENQGTRAVAAGNGDTGCTGSNGQRTFGDRQRDCHVAAVVIGVSDGEPGALQGQRSIFGCGIGGGGDGGSGGVVSRSDVDGGGVSTGQGAAGSGVAVVADL